MYPAIWCVLDLMRYPRYLCVCISYLTKMINKSCTDIIYCILTAMTNTTITNAIVILTSIRVILTSNSLLRGRIIIASINLATPEYEHVLVEHQSITVMVCDWIPCKIHHCLPIPASNVYTSVRHSNCMIKNVYSRMPHSNCLMKMFTLGYSIATAW